MHLPTEDSFTDTARIRLHWGFCTGEVNQGLLPGSAEIAVGTTIKSTQ